MVNSRPLVSVMMPVYNGARLIHASFQSLLNQTYQNWECIIVNDGSKDNTKEIILEYCKKDKRFNLINLPENKGRAFARQTALEASSGKYIAMLDAEDLYHPDKLRRQVELLEQNPKFSMISSAMLSFGTSIATIRKEGYLKDEESIFDGANVPIHASSMLRKNLAIKFKYPLKLKLGEDSVFLSSYLKENPIFYLNSDILYYYSEFDSVSKQKIFKTDFSLFIFNLINLNLKKTAIYFYKFISKSIILPFIPIKIILDKRGFSPTTEEKTFFETNILPLLK